MDTCQRIADLAQPLLDSVRADDEQRFTGGRSSAENTGEPEAVVSVLVGDPNSCQSSDLRKARSS